MLTQHKRAKTGTYQGNETVLYHRITLFKAGKGTPSLRRGELRREGSVLDDTKDSTKPGHSAGVWVAHDGLPTKALLGDGRKLARRRRELIQDDLVVPLGGTGIVDGVVAGTATFHRGPGLRNCFDTLQLY